MWRWLAVAVAGCSFHPGTEPIDAPTADANPYADAPLPDAAPTPDAAPLPCSTAGFECGGTFGAAFTCNGACWVSCIQTLDEPTAEATCAGWSGTLAIERGSGDYNCVADIFTNVPLSQQRASWIGLQLDAGQSMGSSWHWIGQQPPLAFTNWASGEPNTTGPACAYQSTSGLWHTAPCTGSGAAFSAFSCRR